MNFPANDHQVSPPKSFVELRLRIATDYPKLWALVATMELFHGMQLVAVYFKYQLPRQDEAVSTYCERVLEHIKETNQ